MESISYPYEGWGQDQDQPDYDPVKLSEDELNYLAVRIVWAAGRTSRAMDGIRRHINSVTGKKEKAALGKEGKRLAAVRRNIMDDLDVVIGWIGDRCHEWRPTAAMLEA
jgi:hypothetical protein